MLPVLAKASKALICAHFDVCSLSLMRTVHYDTESVVPVSSISNPPDRTAAMRSLVLFRVADKLYSTGELGMNLFLWMWNGSSTFNRWFFWEQGALYVCRLCWSWSLVSNISCHWTLCHSGHSNVPAFCAKTSMKAPGCSAQTFFNNYRIEPYMSSTNIILKSLPLYMDQHVRVSERSFLKDTFRDSFSCFRDPISLSKLAMLLLPAYRFRKN